MAAERSDSSAAAGEVGEFSAVAGEVGEFSAMAGEVAAVAGEVSAVTGVGVCGVIGEGGSLGEVGVWEGGAGIKGRRV